MNKNTYICNNILCTDESQQCSTLHSVHSCTLHTVCSAQRRRKLDEIGARNNLAIRHLDRCHLLSMCSSAVSVSQHAWVATFGTCYRAVVMTTYITVSPVIVTISYHPKGGWCATKNVQSKTCNRCWAILGEVHETQAGHVPLRHP